ncbi:hypothetical protein PHISCL_01920 [Aspergillus sclerotialis]|uniref:RBP protein n=1 Tax=Aspergillus sclerotialis TaxID=2070753 RepID=A0A3A2ZRC8_9EURO|nr:hypothetical protein PHISCL_01920 [Aspergillus sclerotialis]
MTYTNLQAHPLPMDKPAPSEIIDEIKGYRWLMTDTERAHISQMLNVDTSDITIRGNIMAQDRACCKGCGKHSGLDDLIHNALYAGIHTKRFMLDVLTNGPKGPSPPHELICSRCLEKYEGAFLWIPTMPWF